MSTIRHQLIIQAPRAQIYSAITTQKGLSAWWTPDTKTTGEVGSIARFTFGQGYFKEMKITKLKPFEQVDWHCIAGASEWIDTTLSFKLQEGDKKDLIISHPEMGDQILQQKGEGLIALVAFQHENWKEYTPMFAECNYTWGRFLRSLKLFCETGNGRPWPHQHQ
jgi:uncharacterized protein YndB with AHSA1/START domain